MPEQRTLRGDVVTKAAFTGAFETILVRLGAAGLNLKDELDVIPPQQFSRLVNVDHDTNGSLTSRPGQASFATAGTKHHSVRRLDSPATGATQRIWGIDTHVYRGASGALTDVSGGYSGDALTLCTHRPTLSGDPWCFVGDRSQMRKIRGDGLSVPIGLPAPTAAPTAAAGIQYQRRICEFDSTDGSQASAWIGTAGADDLGQPSGIPFAIDDASSPIGPDVYFTTNVGSATTAYDSWLGLALTRDLTSLSPTTGPPGDTPASDDDLMHLWMKTSDPGRVQELRIYLIVSTIFNAAILPGTDPTANTDAYVKSFRQNDFVQFIQASETQIEASETARLFAIRDQDLEDRGVTDTRTTASTAVDGIDPLRAKSIQIGTGAHQWFELGAIGVSLRRGDFQRIGGTANRGWATVTGILVYVALTTDQTDQLISFALDDFYLTGGFGPDTVQPGAQQYDWRTTHYDPRTGAESNGSPTMTTGLLDSRRGRLAVTPQAYGDGSIRQRFYRRGGSLTTDWFFEGQNASDGGVFDDTFSDDSLAAAGSLPTDHFQPVPTIDASGNTVLAQPVAAIWGPTQGMLLACGDPYRPGHLYWSLPDSPDHWSASSNVEICPPSEELMAGDLIGSQAFVFSRERLYLLYPSLSGDATISYSPSPCQRGIPSRQAFCVGPGGIYFVAENEGVFVTQGGPEKWISRDVDPLFQGQARYGLLPVDWTHPEAFRLTPWENRIYVLYQDTGGTRQVLVYHILQDFWRGYTFGRQLATLQGFEEETLLLGGLTTGATYLHSGFSDDGLPIVCTARSGSQSGNRREDKLFGDQILDADRQGCVISVQNFLNEEAVTNAAELITAGVGRQRYILDAFGDEPQAAHSIATELTWTSATAAPQLYQLGYAFTLEPEITSQRVTTWDDLGSPDEVYLTGLTLDVDTAGSPRTIIVERDYNGVRDTVATLTVTETGRHKVKFSWPAVQAHQVRLRPTDDCLFWKLFRADWIYQPEPPRVAGWDVHFENDWDQYYTGLDLFCDTGGATKQLVITVDGVALVDPATSLAYFSVTANGRKVVHLTLPWGRGHVFHFSAIDANPGLLYSHRWHTEAEPSEQANWNQNFSILGSRADKWLKAVIFECDTFGANKSVNIEVDGAVAEILTVNATGRKVVQLALSQERLGRVWRMFPVDSNPGRLYSVQPVFDEEPFQLARWETQEVNYRLPGWFYPTFGYLVLKSTLPVTLTLRRQFNQRGSTREDTYILPATGGVKSRAYQTFLAGRDVFHKWILTSAAPFYLYRDETVIFIQPWGAADPIEIRPFGNSGEDPTRNMVNSFAAATTSGGSADTTR